VKKFSKRIITAFLAVLLLALQISLAVPGLASSSAYDAYLSISDPVKITADAYAPNDPWTPFSNNDGSICDSWGVLYKIDLPNMSGNEFKNFVFRFSTQFYGGNSLRVMGVPANTDVKNLSYTDEPFASMIANETKYLSTDSAVVGYNFSENYYINYADLTTYANKCLGAGDKYMYIFVDSASTAKAFSSHLTDSDYIRMDLYPYYYYNSKPISASESRICQDIQSRIASGKMNHPYLITTSGKLAEIKKNISEGDYWTTYLYEQTKTAADSILETSANSYGSEVNQSHVGIESIVSTLMTVYHVEGDSRYLERAIDEFEVLQGVTDWTAAAQLDNTQTGATVAICYDWLYDYLTNNQRTWAETVIKDKVLSIAYRLYKNPDELETLRKENDYMNIVCGRGTYNHIVYNNSNLSVCALALAPKNPEYSAFIISNNLYNIEPYLDLVGTNGGHEEPIGYYAYTSMKIVSMMSAMQSSLGTMYGYDSYPGFASTAYYPLQMYGAGPFSFGDTGNGKGVFDSNSLYFFAKHTNNKSLMGVLASRFELGNCVNVLLWYDKGELDDVDLSQRLSLDAHLYPTSHGQNIAAFRDNWDIDKGFYAAMYTGCASINGHADAVSGAFCLDAFGERFVSPIGAGDYDYPDYWNNSQNGGRWNWYEKRPEGANCLVINPSKAVGQRVDKTAVFDRFETSKGTSFAITDLSEVYGDYVTSYQRGMMVHQNRSRVVVQDEATMKTPSKIFWSFNTEAGIEILSDNMVVLTSNGKKVLVKISCNVPYSLFKMKAEKLSTSPQSSLQREYPGFSKVAITAENVTKLMLSAEFIPLANEYEWDDEAYTPISMNEWKVSEDYEEKPTLENIYLASEKIDGFESDCYNYEIVYEKIPDTLPTVTFDNPKGYEVNVTYPKDGKVEIVIEVKGKTRTAYYTVLFRQTQSSVEIVETTLGASKFQSALYNPSDSNDKGSSDIRNYLYVGSGINHFYITVDIEEVFDTNVLSAVLSLACAGEIDVTLCEVSGEFTPGVTPYGKLPEVGQPILSVAKSISGVQFIEFDVTDYINRLAMAGETSAGFVLIQNSENTTWVAGEDSDSGWLPSLKISYRENVTPIDISDIKISTVSYRKKGTVTIENKSDMCFGEYVLVGASYEEGKMTDVVLSKPLTVMPHRTKTLSVVIDTTSNMKFFIWKMNDAPVPVGKVLTFKK